jgi:hypothetical protein
MIGVRSALIGHRPAGLGTIDHWSQKGNPTIIKQPLQSLELPRKTRVGQDNAILEETSHSHDRIKEAILPYARGIDPMVGVMMQNTNGGQQATLPYKLGVFRPPVVRQEDSLPLSRLPRQNTSVIQWASNVPDPNHAPRQHQIQQRPDLTIVEGVAFASARADLPHQSDTPSLHGRYHARLVEHRDAPDVERVEQPHPRVVDTIEMTHTSATAAPSMYGILSLPDHHQLGLERLQPLVGVDTNPNYLPQYIGRQGPEVTLRQTIALDVTPRQRAESLLPVRIDRLANAQQQQQPRIDYTTQMTMAPRPTERQPVLSLQRQTHRIDTRRPNVPVVEYHQERRLPVTRDRAVSRQSFTIR